MSRFLVFLALSALAVQATRDEFYENSHRGSRHRDSESDESDSKEGDCGQCEPIKTKHSCREFYDNRYQQAQCYTPKATYFNNKKNGCQMAVLKCKRNRHYYPEGPLSLVSSVGDVLFEGKGEEKLLKCNKKGRWEAFDVHGDVQRVKTAFCLEGHYDAPQMPYPQNPYPAPQPGY